MGRNIRTPPLKLIPHWSVNFESLPHWSVNLQSPPPLVSCLLDRELIPQAEHHGAPDPHPGVDEPVAHLPARHPARRRQLNLVFVLGIGPGGYSMSCYGLPKINSGYDSTQETRVQSAIVYTADIHRHDIVCHSPHDTRVQSALHWAVYVAKVSDRTGCGYKFNCVINIWDRDGEDGEDGEGNGQG